MKHLAYVLERGNKKVASNRKKKKNKVEYWRKVEANGVKLEYRFSNDMSDDESAALLDNIEELPFEQRKIGQGVWKCFIHSVAKEMRPKEGGLNSLKQEVFLSFSNHVSMFQERCEITRSGLRYKGDAGSRDEPLMMVYNGRKDKFFKEVSGKIFGTHDGAEHYFPLKHNPAADTKQNVYLGNLLESLRREDPVYLDWIRESLPQFVGYPNDTMCCLLMGHYATYCHKYCISFYDYVCMMSDSTFVKALSDLCKMLGVALNPFLGLFVEADCLMGRAMVKADGTQELDELSKEECQPDGHNIQFDKGVVKRKVLEMFKEAMPHLSGLSASDKWASCAMDTSEYWSRRFEHCVNGSHHLCQGQKDVEIKGVKTRMGFLQKTSKNVLFASEPMIEATLSWKYESPKVRAIKSADTYSYLNEDYFMKVVEKNWRHPSVLLDPSAGGKYLEGKRVSDMAGTKYVMLDFSAMDKQHSIQSQKEVVEAAAEFMGCPENMKEWLVTSNGNQYVRYMGRRERVRYGLLTGRRMTTFLNTVLNKVYFDLAMGDLSPKSQYHAGDDIVARFINSEEAKEAISRAKASKSVFNPRKQSYGAGSEFLRIATCGDLVMGYVNRSIASTVCGNWVSKLKLSGSELMELYARQSWTLDNRSMCNNFARNLLSFSLARRAKLSWGIAKSVCCNHVSINGTPVKYVGENVSIIKPRSTVIVDEDVINQEGNHAVDDYLRELKKDDNGGLVDERDWRAISKVLKTAAYTSSGIVGYEQEKTLYDTQKVSGRVLSMKKEMLEDVMDGELKKNSTLSNLGNRLSVRDAEKLTGIITKKVRPKGVSIHDWLFGIRSKSIIGGIGLDFDDLCIAAKSRAANSNVEILRCKCEMYVFT
jgi:hypothetical protein